MIRHKKLNALLLGILLLLLCIAVGLGVVFLWRGLYTARIDQWNLEQISGMKTPEILENYNALMDWCSPFHTQPLAFPTLAMSEDGARHFAECKVLFNLFLGIGAVSAVLFAVLLSRIRKSRSWKILTAGGILTLGIPAVLLAVFAINFDQAFILFHKVFFGNDLWIFDPRKDPVILILPEQYFMLCAVVICAAVLLGAAVCIAAGLILSKKERNHE